ncbi:hypothetical protein [Pelosinus fermentans]|uniref:Uncharacterized protein n=1 Tax=Pelosinus fermentans JBW45 TaxID=1192197 RepID=I8TQP7_9FIRM|nr:hypothetical protein [Pelosinus fermentans]AJQ26938.1 hypothetical protein JBW_01588 [Pelosinus fermentans JBW45]
MEIRDIIAGYAAIASTVSIGWNIYLELIKKSNQRKALAGSLIAELLAIENMYKLVELKPWEYEASPPLDIVKIDSNYFAIFDGNTDKIGVFNKEDALIIVGSYIFCKAYVDTLKVLSEQWQETVRFRRSLPLILDINYDAKCRVLDERNKELKDLYNLVYNQQAYFYNNINSAKGVLIKNTLNKDRKIVKRIAAIFTSDF